MPPQIIRIERYSLRLRRGLGLSADYTLARVGWLFRGVPDDRNDRNLNAAILASGLFAWVKGECHQKLGVNFGTTFGRVSEEAKASSREKRFIDLLDTDEDELPYKLRQQLP